jgi:hypothetical protein
LQILLQDKYNIGVLTVNMELMWLGTKRLGFWKYSKQTFKQIYNIGALTVNIEFMWRGLEMGERRALSEFFHPFRAKPHQFHKHCTWSFNALGFFLLTTHEYGSKLNYFNWLRWKLLNFCFVKNKVKATHMCWIF